MMLLKPRFRWPVEVLFLIVCTRFRPSYQQTADMTFCIKTHTMSNTLQTFWHNVNSLCELEAKDLVELYGKLLLSSPAADEQCSALLKHQVRKKLIQMISTQLEEAFVINSLNTNRELKEILKSVQELDLKVAQVVWQRAINEVYSFVEPQEIINAIIHTKEPQLKRVAFESLLSKHLNSPVQSSDTLLPLLTCHIYRLFGSETSSLALLRDLERFYSRLPKTLRFLCESGKQQPIGLLNHLYWEYLYAPRENGPDAERRLPLTWSKTKNSTDSDGHLLATFDDRGLVAFGNRFGSVPKYLYADKEYQGAYFWIGPDLKSSRWWQIVWPHASHHPDAFAYILLQNEETEELLCASLPYDENRRQVTLLNAKENLDNSACFWLVTRFFI